MEFTINKLEFEELILSLISRIYSLPETESNKKISFCLNPSYPLICREELENASCISANEFVNLLINRCVEEVDYQNLVTQLKQRIQQEFKEQYSMFEPICIKILTTIDKLSASKLTKKAIFFMQSIKDRIDSQLLDDFEDLAHYVLFETIDGSLPNNITSKILLKIEQLFKRTEFELIEKNKHLIIKFIKWKFNPFVLNSQIDYFTPEVLQYIKLKKKYFKLQIKDCTKYNILSNLIDCAHTYCEKYIHTINFEANLSIFDEFYKPSSEIEDVLRLIPKNTKRLYLNTIPPNLVNSITELLKSFSDVSHLILHFQPLRYNKMKFVDDSMKYFYSNMGSMNKLKELSIANLPAQINAQGMKALCGVLRSNKLTMKKLELILKYIGLSDETIEIFSGGLKDLKSLFELKLNFEAEGNNKVTKFGISTFSKGIQKLVDLRELDLEFNFSKGYCGQLGISVLFDAIGSLIQLIKIKMRLSEELILDENTSQSFASIFPTLKSLKELEINFISRSSLNEWIENNSLTKLALDYGSLEQFELSLLSEALHKIKNLSSLRLTLN